MPHYIAASIGPIHHTIREAISTKAMWTASYLFSYIMREVVEKVQNAGDLLLPDLSEIQKEKQKNILDVVGLFPDRFFLKTSQTEEAQKIIKEALNDTLEKLSKIIEKDLDSPSQSSILDFLKSYLNFNYVCYEANENAIEIGNNFLDGLETKTIFPAKGNEVHNILLAFFELEQSNFFVEKYKKATVVKNIPDLSSIAKGGKSKEYQFQQYVAVCYADADHIGKLIKNTNNDDQIKCVSKNLMRYSIEATQAVNDFGGLTVFAGGDDLLFFAPLIGKENQDIFGLMEKLDTLFIKYITKNEELKPFIRKDEKPSLSVGISMAYHKFPLKEMLTQANTLLLQEAKKHRNSIAFSLRKHSGQMMESVLNKSDAMESVLNKSDDNVLTSFNNLIKLAISRSENDQILSSMIHRFSVHHPVFVGMFETFGDEFKNYIPHWFKNNFNEAPHGQGSYMKAIKSLLTNILSAHYHQTEGSNDEKVTLALKKLYTCARYADFLQSPIKKSTPKIKR